MSVNFKTIQFDTLLKHLQSGYETKKMKEVIGSSMVPGIFKSLIRSYKHLSIDLQINLKKNNFTSMYKMPYGLGIFIYLFIT